LQDVADHRAHEDRVVADENRMITDAPEQDLRDQRVNVDETDDAVLRGPRPRISASRAPP
jgi:hypothetical protein